MYTLIILLMIQIINSDKNITKEDEKIIRIEDKNKILRKDDYEEIKSIIDKNFPLLLIRILNVSEIGQKKQLSFFEASSFNHFTKSCEKYKDKNMCDYGYAIDIYIKEKLLIIQIGKESKKLLDEIYKQRMIDSIRDELINKNWAHAIKKILIFINYRQNGEKFKNFQKQMTGLKYIFYQY